LIVSNTTVANNTTYHLALVRNGNTLSLYVNGTLDSSATISVSLDSNSSDAIVIGNGYDGTQPVNSYVDDLRLTKGIARYTSNFNVPTAAFPNVGYSDPYFAYDVLLMHMDGANGGKVFTDVTGKVATVSGNVVTSTTQKKQGTTSLYLPGVAYTDNLSFAASSDFVLGGAPFTVELFSYMTAYNSSGGRMVCAGGGAGAWNSTNGIHWLVQSSSTGYTFQYWNGSAVAVVTITTTLNTWNHIAINYTGAVLTVYLNGVSVYSGTVTVVAPSTTPTLGIGTIPGEASNSYAYSGYIDELRITKGAARYLGNFTPPTYPLPDQ
jgi:hypothetical protein